MAYTTISSHQGGGQNWPSEWGTSGTLGIFCTRDFVADDGKSFQQGDGTSLTQQFVTTAMITVAANIPTYGSFILPKTDVATPIDARYMGYIFDANGVQRDLLFGPFDLVTSLGDSITYLAWVNDNAQTRRYPVDTVPTTTQMNLAIAAANASVVPSSTTLKGISKSSAIPTDSANPVHIENTDLKVVANQPATTSAIRSLGTGALQASPGFVGIPSSVTSATIKLWLKADSLSLSDGASVSSWTDSSGNSFNATQATGSNQPTYRAKAINGLPAVQFDGTNDYLTCGHNLDSTVIGASGIQWTTFAVVYSLASATQAIWSKFNYKCTGGNCPDGAPDSGTGRGPRFILALASDLDAAVFSTYGTKLLPLIISDKKDGSTSLAYAGSMACVNQPVVYAGQFNMAGATDTDKIKTWINSQNQTELAQHSGGSGASDNLDSEFLIGADLKGINVPLAVSNPLNGYLAELIVYSGVLSAADFVLVQQYLNTKYGIPVGNIYSSANGKFGVYTVTPSQPLHLQTSLVGNLTSLIENTSTNAVSSSQWRLKNDSGNDGGVVLYGHNYVANNYEGPDNALLFSVAGSVNIATISNKPIKLFINNTTEVARFSETNSNLYMLGGGTIASGATSNTDMAGVLTIGGGGTATYTFTKTHTHAPRVIVTDTAAPTLTPWATATTTVLTVRGDVGHVITYFCIDQD